MTTLTSDDTVNIVNIRYNTDPDKSPVFVDMGREDEGVRICSIWITKNTDPLTQKVFGGFPFSGYVLRDIIIDPDAVEHTSEELLEFLLFRMRW